MDFFKFGGKGSAKEKAPQRSPKGNASGAGKSGGDVSKGFGEILVQKGVIRPPQLEEALAVHNRSGVFIGQVLGDLGYLERNKMVSLLEKHCAVSCMSLAKKELDKETANLIPRDVCVTHALVAVKKDGRNLTVAMADPTDRVALAKVLRACPKTSIKPVLCDRKEIEAAQAKVFEPVLSDDTDLSVVIQAARTKKKPKQQSKPSSSHQPRLGELLVTNKIITQEQCDEALKYQSEHGGFLGQCLVKMGLITQERLTCLLVKQLGMAYFDLSGYEVQRDVIALIPKEICLEHYLLPIDKLGRMLTVAMVNPLDSQAIEKVKEIHPDLRVKPVLCTWEDFKAIAAKELVKDEEKLEESSLDAQPKPEEAVLDEGSIWDAVSAAVTDLFEEAAEDRKEPVVKPVRKNKVYAGSNPFIPGRPAPTPPSRSQPPRRSPGSSSLKPPPSSSLRIDQYQINKEALARIPKDICLANQLLPLDRVGQILAVAMVDTHDETKLELINNLCPGLKVRPVSCSETQFKAAVSRAFKE